MNQFEFDGVFDALSTHPNPEIWHLKNSTHPGIGWSIKTIIPSDGGSMRSLVALWQTIRLLNPGLVTITPEAFDWNGAKLVGFDTVWIADEFDVLIHDDPLSYEITTFEQGLSRTATSTLDTVANEVAQSTDQSRIEDLSRLIEACEAMLASIDSREVTKRRSNIRIMDE